MRTHRNKSKLLKGALYLATGVFFFSLLVGSLGFSPGSLPSWTASLLPLMTSFLLGAGSMFLIVLRQRGRARKNIDRRRIAEIALAHNPDRLTNMANELFLLLDQNPRSETSDSLAGPPSWKQSASHGQEKKDFNSDTRRRQFLRLMPFSGRRASEKDGANFYQSIIREINSAEYQLVQIELEKSRGRYRIVSEFASDWTYWMNPDRELLYVSPACEEICGYAPHEFYRSPELMDSIVHPEDRPTWIEHRNQELAARNPGSMEFRIITKFNDVRWVSHFCKPAYNHTGKFLGICGSNRNITDQKKAEEQLKIKTEELLRSNAELRQFAYVASHDLQAPLRAISGYLTLLSDRHKANLTAEASKFIERAVENASRMQRLIDDLLAYSRLSTSKNSFKTIDCNEVLHDVVEMLQPLIQETEAEITAGTLPVVSADGCQLSQLFQNLIGNAIKFRDQRPPKVHVDARPIDGFWLFSVQDNGIGIEPEHWERIFMIFQRLHSEDRYPGTGIGLAICKKIVEGHGGRIWVESKPGEGSTFKFTIPRRGGSAA